MGFNFFDWLRDGVKRSVLLGVSDAVDQMGQPHDPESSKEKILSFLQEEKASGSSAKRLPIGGTAQKKLGRSLSDIQAAKAG